MQVHPRDNLFFVQECSDWASISFDDYFTLSTTHTPETAFIDLKDDIGTNPDKPERTYAPVCSFYVADSAFTKI